MNVAPPAAPDVTRGPPAAASAPLKTRSRHLVKTSTLRQLADDLKEARRHHATVAARAAPPARDPAARDGDPRMEALLDAVQRELGVRAQHAFRNADALREADRGIRRLLADFLELGDWDADPEVARRAHRRIANP